MATPGHSVMCLSHSPPGVGLRLLSRAHPRTDTCVEGPSGIQAPSSHLPPDLISTTRVLESRQVRGPSGLPTAPQPKGSPPQIDPVIRTVSDSQKTETIVDFPPPEPSVSR